MHKRIFKTVLTLALLITALATVTAQSTISAEKRALIKEMTIVMDVQKHSDLLLKAIIDQFEADAPQRISENTNARTDLTPAQREKMRRDLAADEARVTKRFRELIKEKLDFPQLIEQMMYPVVDKYYTEDDLRNLIAFYKSPTGRKVLETMPQMMADIMVRSNEIIKPKIEQIGKQILDEEKNRGHR